MFVVCQILQVNKNAVDKMSSDYLIHNLQSADILELTVRFNIKGIDFVVVYESLLVRVQTPLLLQ